MKPSREGEGLSLGLEGMPTCLAHLAVAPVRCAAHAAAQPPARCWCGGARTPGISSRLWGIIVLCMSV